MNSMDAMDATESSGKVMGLVYSTCNTCVDCTGEEHMRRKTGGTTNSKLLVTNCEIARANECTTVVTLPYNFSISFQL